MVRSGHVPSGRGIFKVHVVNKRFGALKIDDLERNDFVGEFVELFRKSQNQGAQCYVSCHRSSLSVETSMDIRQDLNVGKTVHLLSPDRIVS